VLMPFFSLVDRRRSLHAELIAEARAQFPHILATEVPDWSEIERMSVRRVPLPASAPQSAAALLYTQLWAEVCERLSDDPPAAAAVRAQRSGGTATATAGTLAAETGTSSTA
jgi:hypothetical protein